MRFEGVPYRRWKQQKQSWKLMRTTPHLIQTKQSAKLITLMGKAIKAGHQVIFECRVLPEDEQRSRHIYDVINLEIRQ